MAENTDDDVRQVRATRMFSSTVMLLNRRMFWNVRARPVLVIALGRPRRGWPLYSTEPDVGS